MECLNCKGQIANFGKTFCSQSCAATFNNKKKPKKTRVCKTCEAVFLAAKRTLHCEKCIQQREYNRVRLLQDLKTDSSRREWLVDKHGHLCFVCKNTEWRGKPITIELDHIDGNSEDNSEKNLRLICPNCHSQTETYKNRNRGKGRKKRKLIYSAGVKRLNMPV